MRKVDLVWVFVDVVFMVGVVIVGGVLCGIVCVVCR